MEAEACTAAPRSQGPVSVPCCRRNDRSTRSDTGRRREQKCTAEPCRHSWAVRRSHCSCTRVLRTTRLHPCRPIRHRCRRARWSQTRPPRRQRQLCRRPPRCLQLRIRHSPQPRHLLPHLEEGRRHLDSHRNSTLRCRARNPDTRLDSARSRRCLHRRHVHRPIQPRHYFRPRVLHFPLLRPSRRRSIHHRRRGRVGPLIHRLQLRPEGEELRLVA